MEYQYYIGDGPEAERIIASINAQQDTWIKKNKAFGERHMFPHFCCDKKGLVGPAFDSKMSMMDAKQQGLKFIGKMEGRYIYTPHRGTKKGKNLAMEIDSINAHWVNVSSCIINTVDMRKVVYCSRERRGASSTAGFCKGKIVVKVPKAFDDYINKESGIISPPAWMREATKAEVDALYAEVRP